MLKRFAAAVGASLVVSSAAEACSTTAPCEVNLGDYYVAMPEGVSGPVPSITFIHGFGGSGPGVFRNTGMVNAYLERGYAVIAPEGLVPPGRNGGSWSFHPLREPRRDEIAFLSEVRDDSVARLGLDPDRMILSGFSIGGSMTAYYACSEPDGFTAYAPTGGNFWRPHPELDSCAGPVRMLHTHGWTDGTVPLEGRSVGGGILTQGDVFYAMQIWRQTNGCTQHKADRFVTKGPFMRRSWERCREGSALELAIFPGGHIVHGDWPEMVMDWFEGL